MCLHKYCLCTASLEWEKVICINEKTIIFISNNIFIYSYEVSEILDKLQKAKGIFYNFKIEKQTARLGPLQSLCVVASPCGHFLTVPWVLFQNQLSGCSFSNPWFCGEDAGKVSRCLCHEGHVCAGVAEEWGTTPESARCSWRSSAELFDQQFPVIILAWQISP